MVLLYVWLGVTSGQVTNITVSFINKSTNAPVVSFHIDNSIQLSAWAKRIPVTAAALGQGTTID